jgi:hypothetical protein
VEESNRIKDGKYFPIMPYAGRYGLTNSALHHEGRSAYITTTLVGTEFRHNINTRLSLGITTTWILAPMLLSGNYSFRKKNSILNFSLSSLVGTGTYLGDFKSYIGVHLLTTTLGNQRNNLSLSVGYGYLKNTMRKKVYTPGEYSYYADISSSGRYQVQQGPVVCLSGKAEISPTVSFILESVFFSYDTETSTIRNAYINAHWENGVYVQSHYANIVSNYTKNMKVIMATPGFRFQLNRNTAFQFSIFGIGTYSNSPDFNAIPMAGFYFKV